MKKSTRNRARQWTRGKNILQMHMRWKIEDRQFLSSLSFSQRYRHTHTYRGIIKASRRFSLQCLDSVEQGGVGVSLLVVKERESGTKTSKKLSHFPSLRNFEGGVSLFLCLFLRLSVFVLSPIRFCANFLIFQEQKLSFGMLSWIKERKMTFYSFWHFDQMCFNLKKQHKYTCQTFIKTHTQRLSRFCKLLLIIIERKKPSTP
jgi:hypothetical protein